MNPFVLSRARALQWLCALVAVSYHVRSLLFVNYGGAAHLGLPGRAFYFFTSLGHEAFLVYLAAAGLLFGAYVAPRWRDSGIAALDGLAAQLRWLYWWLVPALLAGGVLDVAGSNWFAGAGVYAVTPQFHVAHLSLHTLAGNLLLLQDVAVAGYGSNAMLFLLTYEWWMWVAAAAYALGGRSSHARALAGACAIGGTLAWLTPEFLGYWAAWLAGLAAARWGPILRGKIGGWPGALLLALGLLGSRVAGARLATFPPALVPQARLALDLVVALGAGSYLMALQSATPGTNWTRLHRWLAALNPAVYAIHFPLMLFIVAGAAQLFGLHLRAQPTAGQVAAFVLAIALIYLFAWLFARTVAAARAWWGRAAGAGVGTGTSTATRVK